VGVCTSNLNMLLPWNLILTAHRPVNKPMTPDVRLHSLSFTIPWSCTGLSLKSHDCCRSFCEIAIAFQTQWPSNFMTLYTIDSTQRTNSFLFPVALFTRNRHSFRLFSFANPAFSSRGWLDALLCHSCAFMRATCGILARARLAFRYVTDA
jgi:hypothetical protein